MHDKESSEYIPIDIFVNSNVAATTKVNIGDTKFKLRHFFISQKIFLYVSLNDFLIQTLIKT